MFLSWMRNNEPKCREVEDGCLVPLSISFMTKKISGTTQREIPSSMFAHGHTSLHQATFLEQKQIWPRSSGHPYEPKHSSFKERATDPSIQTLTFKSHSYFVTRSWRAGIEALKKQMILTCLQYRLLILHMRSMIVNLYLFISKTSKDKG